MTDSNTRHNLNAPAEEREPLLTSLSPSTQTPRDGKSWRRLLRFWPKVTTTDASHRCVPWLGCTIAFLGVAQLMFEQVPLMRAIEAMYCYEYYRDRGDHPELVALLKHIPEHLCKADQIGKKVSQTAAWSTMFRMFSACVAAVPLGVLADRKGRKIVLILCNVRALLFAGWSLCVFLSYPVLPVWSLYFSALAALIGGTFDLNMSIIIATYVDVVDDAEERSKLIYFTTSLCYLGQLLFPLISSPLIDLDGKGGTAAVALWTSFGTAAVSIILILFAFPETHLRSSQDTQDTQGEHTVDSGSNKGIMRTAISSTYMKLQGFKSAVGALGVPSLILFVFATFSTHVGLFTANWFGITQFPIIKLNWTISMVNLMVSFQAVVYMINSGVFIPMYTSLGTVLKCSRTVTELSIMLFSALILTAGAILIGFSASNIAFIVAIIILALGSGLPITMNAYLSNLIAKDRLGSVLGLVVFASTSGKLVSAAITPLLFGVGIDSGDEVFKGLPMFVAAGSFAMAGFCIVVVSVILGRRSETTGS